MAVVVPSYKGFRYPVEIISHCVWLDHRFPLSFREVEEMMMERGVSFAGEKVTEAGVIDSVTPFIANADIGNELPPLPEDVADSCGLQLCIFANLTYADWFVEFSQHLEDRLV
jgi:hypothetical protein